MYYITCQKCKKTWLGKDQAHAASLVEEDPCQCDKVLHDKLSAMTELERYKYFKEHHPEALSSLPEDLRRELEAQCERT